MGRSYFTLVMIRLIFYIFCFLFFSSNLLAKDDSNFIKAIESKNWTEARRISPQYSTLVTWLELTGENDASYNNLKLFVTEHPNWPKISELLRKMEETSCQGCKNSELLSWFKTHPPKSSTGKKKYLELNSDQNFRSKYAKELWHTGDFSAKEQDKFIKSYGQYLSEADHIIRINNLLFSKKTEQAEKILTYIKNKDLSAFKDRISIIKGKMDVFKKYDISTNNIGILYEIASIYHIQKDDENLIKVLNKVSKLQSPYQHHFWSMKSKLIRDLIIAQDYKTAYLFTSNHGTSEAGDYSEAEWLSGWISLRFLNDAQTALPHFQNILKVVKKPISVSRANYWIARSYEALKNKIESELWYKKAANYFTTFYGQLAACKINQCIVNIPDDPIASEKEKLHFKNNILVNAALVLNKSKKYKHLTQNFLYKAIDNSKSIGEVALITQLGLKLNQNHLAVESAKHASYRDMHIVHHSYPILDDIYKQHEADPALVMALIRQESVFNHHAVSCAGALGLMQIMPHVAKEEAKKLNLKYSRDRLLNDTNFNTQLGTTHLDGLVSCYEPSYILCIAAYNAGDKPVQRWIANNGDPRLMTDIEEIIDWVERISYYETRNYVQRVLEGKSIYHLLISKETKVPLLKDLTEGSGKACPVNR